MLIFVSAIVATYFVTTFLGYWVHWSLHQPWMGKFNKRHMDHHLSKYPPSNLSSEKYRNAGKNSTVLSFIPVVLSILLILFALSQFNLMPSLLALLVGIEVVAIGILHDVIHDSFHVKDSKWNVVPTYDKLVESHFEHHRDMSVNFGIFDLSWDKIFKTFRH